MRTYKFRIYPSKKQETQMKKHLWIEKYLWNKLLEANKKKYDETNKFLTKLSYLSKAKNFLCSPPSGSFSMNMRSCGLA
ncbi:MAG: helix-turn-helix domain-containing protein [Candidatus Aenigmarchaeota archaeon]|nr:helix-turn-helix domain-containing protein [Candidatus Aenigmarchaeota archaeon]